MQQFHAISIDQAFEACNSSKNGLTSSQADQLLSEHGPNALQEGKRKTLLSIFLTQFADLMIWVLIGAAVLSGLFGEWIDALIIAFVVLMNAVLGTVQESKAEAALEALKKMAAPTAKVLRDDAITRIPADQLVVGDVVSLEAGDSIPADLRLFDCVSMKAEESALTGESAPVEKQCDALLEEDTSLGDRVNMAFMSTSITYGRGHGLVVATGMDTQMGSIAGQLSAAVKETTPLQKKLNQISNVLSIGVLAIAAVIFLIGLLSGNEPINMFLTAVSLAVAAIPEGMVAVVTIVLALGMSRMAQRGAIIRRLPAVETLGSTQVICSDKTGTLTQNRMTVQKIYSDTPELLVDAMGHCNDSTLDAEGHPIGDPTETALIDYILHENLWTADQTRQRVREGEIPFDSERKLSTVAITHPSGDGLRVFVKGAPDVLLRRCTDEAPSSGQVVPMTDQRRSLHEQSNESMAQNALRVLAFAFKDVAQADFSDAAAVENNLVFCGLVGMIDPPRPEARDAISVCRRAGVLPVMITGDHQSTAVAIANDLGILSDGRRAVTGSEVQNMSNEELYNQVEHIGVYARVAPEHKTRIVEAWQKHGKIVAMTGDGVNDAPALKTANIGVGMGITGTDVSKGASDMVLTDDNFATIVTAIREGRRIFANIHKTIRFLLSCNAGEVLAILFATIMGWHLLSPVHILWINLVTDTFPALALGVEPAEKDLMLRQPIDSRRRLLAGKDWVRIFLIGFAQATLATVAYLLGGQGTVGTSMAFLTISFSQLFASIGFQSDQHSAFRMKLKEHRFLWLAFFGSASLQLIVFFVPGLRNLFQLSVLSGGQWLIVLGLCLLMLGSIELIKLIERIRSKQA
ncbi:MAG: cation-translocating P-type ATPase [Christensenellales bacterium]|jgi:Ca2+-transporting ATPase